MQIDYPYSIDNRGRTSEANEEDHIRDMIEQILFTSPGERVNRPDFGSGLLKLVFEPNSSSLISSTQSIVQGSLQQWLGNLILVEAVKVSANDSTLEVQVQYSIRKNQQKKIETFRKSIST